MVGIKIVCGYLPLYGKMISLETARHVILAGADAAKAQAIEAM
jgi:hypothetical protein